MIAVLDASAAIKIILKQSSVIELSGHLKRADWVIAPDIFVSEVTNVYWKYHQFENLPLKICADALQRTIELIDDCIKAEDLYREAFSFSCQVNHSVYDSMYLICARRYDALLLSVDNKLIQLARKHSLKLLG